jgi:hypothetical protein
MWIYEIYLNHSFDEEAEAEEERKKQAFHEKILSIK